MNHQAGRKAALGALTAALVMVATALIKIPGPLGYIHAGDAVLFAMAVYFGSPAVAGAAVGSALADLMAGYALYAPVSLVIKGLMALIAVHAQKGGAVRRLLLFIAAEIAMIAGYFVFEWAVYGAAAAGGAIVFNLVQGAFGVIVGQLLCARRLRGLLNLQD